eukprot:129842_1
MAKHTRREKTKIVWDIFFDQIKSIILEMSESGADCETSCLALVCVVNLMEIWVKIRVGDRIHDRQQFTQVVLSIFTDAVSGHKSSNRLVSSALDILGTVWYAFECSRGHFESSAEYGVLSDCLAVAFGCTESCDSVVKLFGRLKNFRSFTSKAIPLVSGYIASMLESDRSPSECFNLLLELSEISDDVKLAEMLNFESNSSIGVYAVAVLTEAEDNVGAVLEDSSKRPLLWAVLKCLPLLRVNEDSICGKLTNLAGILQRKLVEKKCDDVQNKLLSLVAECDTAFIRACAPSLVMANGTVWARVSGNLKEFRESAPALKVARLFLEYMKCKVNSESEESLVLQRNEVLSENTLRTFVPVLATNLSHPAAEVRRLTVEIFDVFPTLQYEEGEKKGHTGYSGDCQILSSFRFITSTSISMDVEREFTRRLRLIESVVLSGKLPADYLALVPNFLIGVLRIKFSMLWEPTINVFSAIAKTYPESVCGQFFDFLGEIANETHITYKDPKVDTKKAAQSSTEFSGILSKRFDAVLRVEMRSTDKFMMHKLLLQILRDTPGFTQKYQKRVVDLFLHFMSAEYDVLYPPDISEVRVQGLIERARHVTVTKLDSFLQVFAAAQNAQGLSRADELRDVFKRLLMKPLENIQKLALSCLLLWKPAYLTPYASDLQRMIPAQTFRDEITLFKLERDSGKVSDAHRDGLIPVVIRILLPKVLQRKGKSSGKSSVGSRRSAIFSYLGGLSSTEITPLIDLLLSPFQAMINDAKPEADGRLDFTGLPISASESRQISFVKVFGDLLSHLRSLIDSFLPKLLSLTFHLLETVNAKIMADREANEKNNQNNEIRSLCFKQIAAVVKKNTKFDFRPFLPRFFRVAAPLIRRLSVEATQQRTGLLDALVAFSRRSELVMELNREQFVLDSLFGCIGAKKAQKSVVNCVLEVVTNILELRESKPEMAAGLESVLRQHMSVLLTSLQSWLQGQLPTNSKARFHFPTSVLELIVHLGQFASDSHNSQQMLELLLPLLEGNIVSARSFPTLVNTLVAIIPRAQSLDACVDALAPLLQSTNNLAHRVLLCKAFVELGKKIPYLEKVADVLMDMNAMAKKRVNMEYDFDRRMNAYEVLKTVALSSWSDRQLTPVIHNVLHDVADEEFTVRHSAVHVLGMVLAQSGKAEEADVSDTPARAPRHFTDSLAREVIAPVVLLGLRGDDETVLKEFVLLLSTIVRRFPEEYGGLHHLHHRDPEADFFENIMHMQRHRRRKALGRLQKVFVRAEGPLTTRAAGILTPLLNHFIFIVQGQAQQSIRDEAIRTIGVIAGTLPWPNYYRALNFYMRKITQKPALERALVRTVVAMVDAFHFDLTSGDKDEEQDDDMDEEQDGDMDEEQDGDMDEEKDEMKDGEKEVDGESKTMEDDEGKVDISVNSEIQYDRAAIIRTLKTQVVPRLKKCLKDKKSYDLVRMGVAVALAKLLKVLPKRVFKLEFPKLLTAICNSLRSRDQSTRDEARAVLVRVAAIAGPAYFKSSVWALKHALLRGYQLQVLGYTMHTLLNTMVPTVKPGDIDPCIGVITKVLLDDLTGEIAEVREVDKIRNAMTESKVSKSFQSFELMARIVRFSPNVNSLVGPVIELLRSPRNYSISVIRKLERVLRSISNGLLANKSVEPIELLIYVHQIVSAQLKRAKPVTAEQTGGVKKSLKPSKAETMTVQAVPKRSDHLDVLSDVGETKNIDALISFGLTLLHTTIKRKKLDMSSPETRQMLDPFTALLKDCLEISKTSTVWVAVLKCSDLLTKFKLPSMAEFAPVVANFAFSSLVSSTAELVAACFRTLSVFLRHCEYVTIDQGHLATLAAFVKQHLEDHDKQAVAFSLLKSIVNRRVQSPDIYDLMKRVQELLVQSQVDVIQQHSAEVLLQFLLYYKLGRKRLQQHLNFLVNNLGYDVASGRQAVLELLSNVAGKFPEEVIEDNAEVFIIRLVMQLVNDDSPECKKMIAAVLRTLLGRLKPQTFRKIVEMSFEWFKSEKHLLQCAAAQLVGLAMESPQKTAVNLIPKALELVLGVLRVSADQQKKVETYQAEQKPLATHEWQAVYMSVICFEKMYCRSPTFFSSVDPSSIEIWSHLTTFLLHFHTWVRLASARVMGRYFASLKLDSIENHLERTLLQSGEGAFLVGRRLCSALDSEMIEEALATQIIKDLLFTTMVIHRVGQCGSSTPEATIENHTKPCTSSPEKSEMNQSCSDQKELIASPQNDSTDNNDVTNSSPETDIVSNKNNDLTWIIGRMSDMAKRQSRVKKESVFKWFAALITQLDTETVVAYLRFFMMPLYQASIAPTATDKSEKFKEFTQKVLDSLKEKIGADTFLKAYNDARQQINEKRAARKRKRAVERVAEPHRAAKRRQKENLRKKSMKKQKISKFRKRRHGGGGGGGGRGGGGRGGGRGGGGRGSGGGVGRGGPAKKR